VPQSWLGLTWASLSRLPWIRAGFYYGPHLTEGGFGLIVARKAVRWPVQIGPDTTNIRRKGHGFQATEFSLVYQHGIPPSGYVYMVRTSMSRESPTTLPYHGPTGSPVASPSPHCTAQCRPPGRSCGARPLAPSSMHGKQCHTSNSASQLGILPSSGVVGTPRTRACKLCPTIIPVTLPRCIQSCMQAPAPITSALLLPKFARDALGSAFGEQGSRCDGSFRVVAFLMIA
jgi:hypothetical protein